MKPVYLTSWLLEAVLVDRGSVALFAAQPGRRWGGAWIYGRVVAGRLA